MKTVVTKCDRKTWTLAGNHLSTSNRSARKSHRGVRNAHDDGYVSILGIELAHKHVKISPMFVICSCYFFSFLFFFFLFFFLISIISRFSILETTIDRTLFRRPTSPV